MTSDTSLLLTATAMRHADLYTIDTFGMPGHTLMECAGRATLALVRSLEPRHVGILCGKGNNGGDGLVLARLLADRGVRVTVLLAAGARTAGSTDDAARNEALLFRLQKEAPDLSLNILTDLPAARDAMADADMLVDALLGTGLERAVRSPFSDIIDWMNGRDVIRVALDVPSGLSSDTGGTLGTCVQAHHTVTFGAAKVGLYLGDGPDVAGTIHVADIGLPSHALWAAADAPGCAVRPTAEAVRALLRPRTRSDHKYTTGPTLVIGGSDGFPGAPALAAHAAARSGSGYVVVACPPTLVDSLQHKLTEIPVVGWIPDHPERITDALATHWQKARAIVLGPGLGRSRDAGIVVKTVLTAFDGPVVIDADALHALSLDPDWTRTHARPYWIMTPHAGEFARLADALGLGIPSGAGSVVAARTLADALGCVVVSKGMPSVIAGPGRMTVVNASGNPAAGTAGTGDVLSGIIGGLAATGVPAMDAAAAGMHIAGTAADHYVQEHASQSMMAGDILARLPALLAHYS